MAYRFLTRKLVVSCCVAALTLSGCAITTPSDLPTSESFSPAEQDLRAHSAAMQKTVYEAIALGGIAGLATRFLVEGPTVRGGTIGGVGYFTFGAGAGAIAGQYVARIQQNFANEEQRIEAMRADLAANNAETRAALQVMKVVLNNQRSELRRLQSAVAAGTADASELAAEVQQAQANLAEMDRAADGATGRFNEFTDARNAHASNGAQFNSELNQLSNQIAQMRGVAENLAGQL